MFSMPGAEVAQVTIRASGSCSLCGEALTAEEREYPKYDRDGGVLCETCWDEEFRGTCYRCGERVERADLPSAPGFIIAVWRSAPALGGRLRRGYYRVLEWPFFADGMIEGFFYSTALERLAPLDVAGRRAGSEAASCAGPLCPTCRDKVSAMIALRSRGLVVLGGAL
jgi:hypothetical protein